MQAIFDNDLLLNDDVMWYNTQRLERHSTFMNRCPLLSDDYDLKFGQSFVSHYQNIAYMSRSDHSPSGMPGRGRVWWRSVG